MKLPNFKLEEFWKQYEFKTPYLLCPSDMETWRLDEILGMADDESSGLWNELRLGYTEVQGLPLLRQEIAKLYSKILPEQILTTAGAEEGIYCTLQAVLKPGDHVIGFTPGYESLEVLPKALGVDVSLIALDPSNDWKLDVQQVINAFTPATKMLILNNPHNPTGTLIDKTAFYALIDAARAHNAHIFCDEVYRYLEIDETQRLPAMADAYEKGISLNVMTKAFGLGGLRIGWVASQDETIIERIASYKLYTSICNSATSEILALMALRAKEAILHRNRSIMLHNLNTLDSFFAKHSAHFRWKRPQSGSVAFPELTMPIQVDAFMHKLIDEAGILIMPASIFDIPGNYFRIGFGRRNLPAIIQKLEAYLCNMKTCQ